MNGFGMFYWKEGMIYQGEYKEDKKNNFGVFSDEKGKKYEGYWEKGVKSKLGKYTKTNGQVEIGYWNNNQTFEIITDENELEIKKNEIEKCIAETKQKVNVVLLSLQELLEQNTNKLNAYTINI
jgi:hypothetical protein